MDRGKDKCEILRSIRRKVAEKYGLRYEPTECHHEGDCLGTFPLCDAELRSLHRQLEMKGITNVDIPKVDIFNFNIDDVDKPTPLGDVHQLQGEPIPLQGQYYDPNPAFKYSYIAGLSFHHIEDIWDELYEGASLALVRQPDNKYDKYAVAVALSDDYNPDDPDSFDFKHILGYIPRKHNPDIAIMMDKGHQFIAEILSLNEHASYDKRIEISIYKIDKQENKPSKRLRVVSVDNEGLSQKLKWLNEKGVMYFRWSDILPLEVKHNLPIKDEKVVVLHKRDSDTIMYLTKVIAVDDDASFFFDSYFDVHLIDNCSPFILGNIAGPIVVPNWSLEFLDKEPIDECQPEKFLSKSAQSKLEQIFKL